ncbi:MAG: hypothetical protein BJ554DRAFT_5930, partial [Olpidium bornovanus]
MELTDEEILAVVQEGENQEEDNAEEEQVSTITKAEKLQSLGVAASFLDLSKEEHRNAHKVLRNVQFELCHKSVTQRTLASWIRNGAGPGEEEDGGGGKEGRAAAPGPFSAPLEGQPLTPGPPVIFPETPLPRQPLPRSGRAARRPNPPNPPTLPLDPPRPQDRREYPPANAPKVAATPSSAFSPANPRCSRLKQPMKLSASLLALVAAVPAVVSAFPPASPGGSDPVSPVPWRR